MYLYYVLYSRGPNQAGLPKKEFGEALILVAVVCLTGFFAMRHALKKIARRAGGHCAPAGRRTGE